MRPFATALLAVFVVALAGAALTYGWLNQPMQQIHAPSDLSIEPGTSVRQIAAEVTRSGVAVDAGLLYWWFRLSGESRLIKAGSYEIEAGDTPRSLLRKLVRGDETLKTLTLVEGWNFRQLREALQNAPDLRHPAQSLSSEAIMAQLGRGGVAAEGRFYPDTYSYAKGTTDLALLERAARAMDKHLAQAWMQRDSQSPLKSADEALILASIVEKETGVAADRPMVASVFSNRLRIGMRLQTDPTVIYGLGQSFDGNLRKSHLLADTPWNTYTRAGLPPTPIAMPGKAALLAAVQPAHSNALYFVARGDGSSEFSSTLDAHNRAVNKYQRKP